MLNGRTDFLNILRNGQPVADRKKPTGQPEHCESVHQANALRGNGIADQQFGNILRGPPVGSRCNGDDGQDR